MTITIPARNPNGAKSLAARSSARAFRQKTKRHLETGVTLVFLEEC
jgi:hypothetical protein